MKAHLTCVICMWSPLAPVKAGPHNGTLKLHWKIEGLLYTVHPLLASHGKPALPSPAQWMDMDEWMTGWCVDRTLFFTGFLFPQLNSPIAEGSKSVGGILKLSFIQMYDARPKIHVWSFHLSELIIIWKKESWQNFDFPCDEKIPRVLLYRQFNICWKIRQCLDV